MAFYLANGTEVVEGSELADDVTIYVTCGENFGGGALGFLESMFCEWADYSNLEKLY